MVFSRDIGAPGHDKNVVDGLNDIQKEIISDKMIKLYRIFN